MRWSLCLIKLQALMHAALLKKGLQDRFFPVEFAKFLRTSFFTEHLRWLLLPIEKLEVRFSSLYNTVLQNVFLKDSSLYQCYNVPQ